METWAKEGAFNANFICICVNGDSTSLPVAKDFGTRYQIEACFNGYISENSDLPTHGQLGCQGLILVDAEGNFISERTAAFTQQREKAFRMVEKKLFQLGAYKGVAKDFEGPALRFPVGTRVECLIGRNLWAQGRVVELRVFSMNREMPYKIELDDGRLILAPLDSHDVIRKVVDDTLEIPSVGVKEMDEEHEECLVLLKQLEENLSRKSNNCCSGNKCSSSESSRESLKEVYDSLSKHFEHEEDLFAQTGFGNHGTSFSDLRMTAWT